MPHLLLQSGFFLFQYYNLSLYLFVLWQQMSNLVCPTQFLLSYLFFGLGFALNQLQMY